MNDILLIGSGQHCNVVMYNIEAQGKYNIVGILDNDTARWGKKKVASLYTAGMMLNH